jgi:hypothetical protein
MADATIRPPAAAAKLGAQPLKVTVTMPLAWMVRGLLEAIDRFDQAAATSSTNAERPSIALFEVSNWLDSICQRPSELRGDRHIRAFRYVRQRTHHGWASAIEYDPARSTWAWRRHEILPAPDPGREKPKLERLYTDLLAERPVGDVLERLRKRVGSLPQNA